MTLKRDLTCPHCGRRKFWRIEKIQERTVWPDFPAEEGRVADLHEEPAPLAVVLKVRGRHFESLGRFETWICNACGFTEWYAQGLERLRADPEEGVHLLDFEKQEGPYR